MSLQTLLAPAVFLLSFLLTAVVRKLALARGVLDVPNSRSSHRVPTPRGGGIAIVVATLAGIVALFLFAGLAAELFWSLTAGGIAVATIGFLDDRYGMSAKVRLTVHFVAALWVLFWLNGLPPLHVAGNVISLGIFGYVLGALAIVWMLNLFNFMDGIDGIAASQAVFMVFGAAALTFISSVPDANTAAGLVFGAACCGFLVWNWPPARIFMGDVGSGYIGFVIAVLALASARENPVALPVWLILGGIFVVDATVTLIRRLARGEKVHEAHRSHAYQWLARRWGSHRRVVAAAGAVNLAWLFPCAWVATAFPRHAVWMVAVAWVPLIVAVLSAGAGRREA